MNKNNKQIIIFIVVCIALWMIYKGWQKAKNPDTCTETEQEKLNRENCSCMGVAINNNANGIISVPKDDGSIPMWSCSNLQPNDPEPCPCNTNS